MSPSTTRPIARSALATAALRRSPSRFAATERRPPSVLSIRPTHLTCHFPGTTFPLSEVIDVGTGIGQRCKRSGTNERECAEQVPEKGALRVSSPSHFNPRQRAPFRYPKRGLPAPCTTRSPRSVGALPGPPCGSCVAGRCSTGCCSGQSTRTDASSRGCGNPVCAVEVGDLQIPEIGGRVSTDLTIAVPSATQVFDPKTPNIRGTGPTVTRATLSMVDLSGTFCPR